MSNTDQEPHVSEVEQRIAEIRERLMRFYRGQSNGFAFIESAPQDVGYLLDQLAAVPAQIEAARDDGLREYVEHLPDLSATGIALVDAIANARLADLADSLLMARSVHYTRERLRAAIRSRGVTNG